MDSVLKLLREPAYYVPRLPRVGLQQFCWLFQNRSFYLQGQMDIHPKARWRPGWNGGFFPGGDEGGRRICNLDAWDNTRRDMLALMLRSVIEQQVPGRFVELGVFKGLTARLIHHYAPERILHLFDTFEGFTDRSSKEELQSVRSRAAQFSNTSLERVQRFIGGNDNVRFHKGFFPETVPAELKQERFAFVHLDADLYEPTIEGLWFFYPRMSRRGIIIVHDYNSWPGVRRAVDEFFADKPELPLSMPDKNGSAVIVKQS
jgi:O-methyltransferase